MQPHLGEAPMPHPHRQTTRSRAHFNLDRSSSDLVALLVLLALPCLPCLAYLALLTSLAGGPLRCPRSRPLGQEPRTLAPTAASGAPATRHSLASDGRPTVEQSIRGAERHCATHPRRGCCGWSGYVVLPPLPLAGCPAKAPTRPAGIRGGGQTASDSITGGRAAAQEAA